MNEAEAKAAVKRQNPDARKQLIAAAKVDGDNLDLWARDRKELPAEVVERIVAFADGNYVHISTQEGLVLMPRPAPAVVQAPVAHAPYAGNTTAYDIGQPAAGCRPYVTAPGGPVMAGKKGTKPLTLSLPTFGRK